MDARRVIESVFREEYGRILASLIRYSGDIEVAEEALQDALAAACERWPEEGTPRSPAGWLSTTARHRLIDRLRRKKVHADSLAELQEEAEEGMVDRMRTPLRELPHSDDRLRLVFTCCHPALAHEAQVALTLNTLCGLTVSEIARAFLVKEQTMAQRLVRAKRKIKEAAIPYEVPPPALLAERVPAVLSVVYLLFNEGYATSRGDELVRRELTSEAIRLGRLLETLLPDETEVRGLLALMLLQDARRDARSGEDGSLILLEDQDRSLWDAEAISEGQRRLEGALALGRPGPYQIQAAIAAVHASARRAEDVDWREIVGLYDALLAECPSPVIALNRAVAVAMADGPEAGLREVGSIEAVSDLDDYVYLHATRADFLRRLGRIQEAREAYARARALAASGPERTYMEQRLRELA